MSQQPKLSVIVPTHNRRQQLEQSLIALSNQSYPSHEFEVIVVADSCQDNTDVMVTAYAQRVPYQLHLLSHTAKSAAATRNLGAANAQGQILLFLDDDIVAQPDLIEAHVKAHHPQRAVLGYSKPVLPKQPSWFQQDIHRWWEDTFSALRQPGHRFSYRDFFSGNLSLAATLFRQVGGFDEQMTGRLEDYELGLRLLKVGSTFQFAPDAVGLHYEHTDLAQWIRRIRQEGVADVQIGQRHLEIRPGVFARLNAPASRFARRVYAFAFANPHQGDWLESLWLREIAICEQLRLRDRWRKRIDLLREYNYRRGVAAAIGGKHKLSGWFQEAPIAPKVAENAPVLDMGALPSDEVLQGILQQANQTGIRLAFAGVEVLAMPPQAGVEPLRADHLHSALRTLAKRQFIPGLALHLVRTTVGGALC